MEDFKGVVKSYMDVHSQIQKLGEELKGLKTQKESLEKPIMEYMKSHNIDCCNIQNGGSVLLKKSTQLGALNKDVIQQSLENFFSQPRPENSRILAEESTEYIMKSRDTKEKFMLKVREKK